MESNNTQKLLWISIKSDLRKDIQSRKLKNPNIRLGAIENIEKLLRAHFNNEYRNPIELLKLNKDAFKIKLGQYKSNGSLNGAEISIINNIYDFLELNKNNVEIEIVSETIETENAVVRSDENNIPVAEKDDFSFEKFSNELKLLNNLFGESFVSERYERLKTIYDTTEKFWEEQLSYLPNGGIKYLFIAEAPPYSPDGDVTYIYNPNSEPRTLLKALSKAFFNESLYNTIGTPETLKRLALEGLIIIDTLPFAMDYSSKRGSSLYEEMIGLTVNTYLLPKLNRVDLNWSKDLKVGFGFKRNAIAVIEKLNGELKINKLNKSIKITSDMITANDAGYPDAQNIKKVFGL